MGTKDDFAVSALKVLLSAVSLAIMLPMMYNLDGVSFYATVSVYVLGKFVDLVAKLTEKQLKMLYVIYIAGIGVAIVAVALCFYAFASAGSTNSLSNALCFNGTLMFLPLYSAL